jgi:hypothetical protein
MAAGCPRKEDYPALDTNGPGFLSWWRQAGVLLLGAFFVSTIMSSHGFANVPTCGIRINMCDLVAELSDVRNCPCDYIFVLSNATKVKVCSLRIDADDNRIWNGAFASEIARFWSEEIWGQSSFVPSNVIKWFTNLSVARDTSDLMVQLQSWGVPAIPPFYSNDEILLPRYHSILERIVSLIDINKGAIDKGILPVGNAGDFRLILHDPRLAKVDYNLSGTDSDQRDGQDDFAPMRPYRGMPAAAGWAAMMIAGWFWAACHDYDAIAFAMLIAAFAGSFGILILLSGLFPGFAFSAVGLMLSHGLGLSV